MNGFLKLLGVSLISLLLATGCDRKGSSGSPDGENDVVSVTKQETVEQRAQQKWEAAVQGDWARVYDFMSPGMRKLRDKQSFVARMQKAALAYTKAEVQGAECEEESCDVTIRVYSLYRGVIQAAQGMEFDALVHEKWIWKEGAWWFVPK
jgi:hypothetical protein